MSCPRGHVQSEGVKNESKGLQETGLPAIQLYDLLRLGTPLLPNQCLMAAHDQCRVFVAPPHANDSYHNTCMTYYNNIF